MTGGLDMNGVAREQRPEDALGLHLFLLVARDVSDLLQR
jgi:hypothetical protein